LPKLPEVFSEPLNLAQRILDQGRYDEGVVKEKECDRGGDRAL